MHRNWTELVKPRKIEVDEKTLTSTYGKFHGEPFERGFAVTLGNVLRRTLLSSLQGAAITSVRVQGVLHEFSTIPGVKEDVTDIVLNLKELRLRLNSASQHTLRISAKREGVVRASDIEAPPEVEILNPDHAILTLAKDAEVGMEMVVRTGKGFVPAERNKNETDPLGTIPMDAAFSPVSKVNFSVTGARVAQRTDYERLALEIWTDGSLPPREALGLAARILQDQLSIFIPLEEAASLPRVETSTADLKFDPGLFQTVEELGLSQRTVNGLALGGIRYVGELVQKVEHELLKTKNFGRVSLNEVKQVLGTKGLELGMRLESFPSREEIEKQTKWKEDRAE
jgi:DNA-directed RNA polymerase subunit alpha